MPTVYIRQDLYVRIIQNNNDPSAYVNTVVAAALDVASPNVSQVEKQEKLIKVSKVKKSDS